MISKNKRKRYQKTIAKFCLMDDTFMAKFFENNIEDTEFLLHLILEDDKIRVEKVIGQYAIAMLISIRLYLSIMWIIIQYNLKTIFLRLWL